MKSSGFIQKLKEGVRKVTDLFIGRLRNRIIVLFLMVALIPLVATSIYIVNEASSALINKQKESYEKLAIGTADIVDEYIEQRMTEVKILAATTDIKSKDLVVKSKFLKNFAENTDAFDGITYTNSDGIVFADTFGSNFGSDLSDRWYIKDGLEGKDSYSEVVIAKSTGKRSIIVATPVKGEDNTITGVLSGLIDFEELMKKYTYDLYIDDGAGYPIVVDSKGVIQLHPNQELIGKTVSESGVSQGLAHIMQSKGTRSGDTTYQDGGNTFIVIHASMEDSGYELYLNLPQKAITEEVDSVKKEITIVVLIVMMVVSAIAYFVSRQISRPIMEVASVTKRISTGDLTVSALKIRTRDEVGQLSQSVNAMVENLRGFISKVQFTAEEVATSAEELYINAEQASKATEQIATTIEQMAEGTDQQLRDTEASVSTITEVAEDVLQVAANAQQVTDSAMQTSRTAGEGNEEILTVIAQMHAIQETVTRIADIISNLGARSIEIEDMAKVISEMAAQTNLLSLNAAIEAARAGEHGRGFAVVADEIRKLAEHSARSAGQIGQLVSAIQSETHLAVESMAQGTKEVGLGIEVVDHAGKSFEIIQQSINQVAAQIQEVTAYSQQMQSSTEQAVAIVSQISEVAKRSADGTKDISAAAQEQLASIEEVNSFSGSLATMAEDLRNIAKGFKL
ncbi:methyl-accepting chemotaxis protein [Paenibacillus albiflavus]|uniref:Methyl-accepting chemotaxis protein n=1 Tax=Paenibacillus albiflavus TaxID=2545760 RepID=A0A4R4EFX6_9BACL|nr:methyl-accepting chemotaxis protein [Paenibacillus albiflavus]TCZ78183.1 methyl-accepting chemotaxis protein [Paenibacillus albiflavus]